MQQYSHFWKKLKTPLEATVTYIQKQYFVPWSKA